MGHFFAEILLGMIYLLMILLLLTLSFRTLDCIWTVLYALFQPCLCIGRRIEPWPIELCNILCWLCENIAYGCSICCFNVVRIIKISKVKMQKKFKVEPIIYDNVHIIIMNPNDDFVLGTKSIIVNN